MLGMSVLNSYIAYYKALGGKIIRREFILRLMLDMSVLNSYITYYKTLGGKIIRHEFILRLSEKLITVYAG